MYIHISDLLFCTAEINTTSYSNYMPIFKKEGLSLVFHEFIK